MPVGLVPVNVAVLRVDLHVHGPAHPAAVRDSCLLDALKNRVEIFLADAEAEVLDGEGLGRLVDVVRQAVVDVDRSERPDAGFRPGDS